MDKSNIEYELLKPEDGYIVPDHYKGSKYQSIEIMRKISSKKRFMGYCLGYAIKYLTRITDNNIERNIKKAKYYIEELINYLKAQGETIDESRIHPDYYKKSGIETNDIIEDQLNDREMIDGYYINGVLRYIFRAPKKHGIEDLAKASCLLDIYISKFLQGK